MKLFVVDDDPDFNSLIEQTAPAWLEVVTSSSSRAAIPILHPDESAHLAVAVVDVHLPAYLERISELEGIALVRQLRRHGQRMPVILVSSHPPPRGKGEADLPVLGFLRKPLDLTRLYRFMAAYAELFGPQRDPGTTPVAPGGSAA